MADVNSRDLSVGYCRRNENAIGVVFTLKDDGRPEQIAPGMQKNHEARELKIHREQGARDRKNKK